MPWPVRDKLAWVRAHYEPFLSADVLESAYQKFAPGPLVGTPEQIVERLTEARGLGMSYAITYFLDAAYDRSSIELFTDQVIRRSQTEPTPPSNGATTPTVRSQRSPGLGAYSGRIGDRGAAASAGAWTELPAVDGLRASSDVADKLDADGFTSDRGWVRRT